MRPFDPGLLDALEAGEVEAVIGTVWRQVLEPTSVMRPNQRGARWNPSGTEALYCALDPITAAAEVDHLLSAQSVPITRPRVTYALDVAISRVVDIRPDSWSRPFTYAYDPANAEHCQTIGAAAAWLGCGGLLVRSLRSDGDNLVILMANLAVDDSAEPEGEGYPYPPGPPPDLTWSQLRVAP